MPAMTGGGVGEAPGALPSFSTPIDDAARGMRYAGDLGAAAQTQERVFANLSSQLGQWADSAARDEGARAGKVAGLDPNYSPNGDESIYGQSFRQNAENSYVNNVEASARQQLTSAYDNYNALPGDQRDPAKLSANIQQIQQTFHDQHVFPEIQGQFDTTFNAMAQSFVNGAQSDQVQRTQDAAKASFLTNQNSATTTAMRMAAIPSTSDAALTDLTRQQGATVDQAVNQGIYTAVQGVQLKQAFQQQILGARVTALFDNTQPAQKQAFAANFAQTFASSGERDLVTRTVLGEAGHEGQQGMAAVAHVIKNRLDAGTYGATASQVVLAPAQFSLWNSGDPAGTYARSVSPSSPEYQAAAKIVDDAFAGKSIDPTNGADHYYNPSAAAPAWGPKLAAANDVTIGNHRFVGKIAEGGQPVALSDNPASSAGQTAGLTPETVASVSGYMASALRAQQSQAQHAEKLATADIGQSVKQMENGFPVSDADWALKRQQYGASADPVVQQSFQQGDAIRSMYASFRGMTPAQVTGRISQLDAAIAGGANNGQVELRDAAQRYADRLRDDLNTSPLTRAARDGLIPAPAPLDFSSGDAFARTLATRVPAAQQAQAAYGMAAPRYLTPDERSQIKSVAANGGEPMVQMAAAAAHVLGPDAGRFLSEIGGDAPSFSQMGRVAAMNGDAGLLRDAGWTINQDQSKGGKVLRPAPEVLQQGMKDFSGAFSALPDFASGGMALASNALAAQIAREGLDPKTLDRNMVSQTLQKSFGASFVGNTQYGGVGSYRPGWVGAQKVLLPSDLRADQFGAAVAAIGDGDLKALPAPPVAKDGTPMTAAQMRGMNFVSVGPGVYYLAKNDPTGPDPQYATTPSGAKFTLDLNALAPALRARVPGAWKGQI